MVLSLCLLGMGHGGRIAVTYAGFSAKYGPPAIAAVAMFDWTLAVSILFGFIAGWAGAASLFQDDQSRKIWQRVRTSILASGVGLLIVLWAIRVFNLDPLGAATVAAMVGVLGVNAVEIFRNGARNWLRSFVQTAGDALGDQRQELAKSKAAKELIGRTDDDRLEDLLARLEEAEKRRRPEGDKS